MRLLIIAVMLISGCATSQQFRVHDTRWSEYNLQMMIECGKLYKTDADYSECLLINNATI